MSSGSRPDSVAADPAELQALFDEVSAGLRARPKRIPEKLLYDERGSELFEEITRLDAYYPTRTEIGILERCLPELCGLAGPRARVVEFGTGEGTKTGMLLDTLERPAACIPIDISETQLLASAERLRMEYPEMEVVPLVLDYTRPFELLEVAHSREPGRILFFFPGSTIGNLEPADAERFLARVGLTGGRGSTLLLGVDLVKPAHVLERAYDDPEGVTAEFNVNALRHVNRVLEADFAVSSFRHRALWNEERSRIEMRLVCGAAQEVTLAPDLPGTDPTRIEVEEGEEIVTEHSYKYRADRFSALCRRAGWRTVRAWTDPKAWFSVQFLEWEGPHP